ncbi:uncharacterized protein MONOS_4207 [Monocercomonoides exilis]|uniref:uncharacterized protein n=1 Tax=Monocercomonoides exilis TaxID=2049356 RepID=UPI003559855E|nr:hypothetical protein MONOS_4207 [Monocercomonoides exilis]
MFADIGRRYAKVVEEKRQKGVIKSHSEQSRDFNAIFPDPTSAPYEEQNTFSHKTMEQNAENLNSSFQAKINHSTLDAIAPDHSLLNSSSGVCASHSCEQSYSSANTSAHSSSVETVSQSSLASAASSCLDAQLESNIVEWRPSGKRKAEVCIDMEYSLDGVVQSNVAEAKKTKMIEKWQKMDAEIMQAYVGAKMRFPRNVIKEAEIEDDSEKVEYCAEDEMKKEVRNEKFISSSGVNSYGQAELMRQREVVEAIKAQIKEAKVHKKIFGEWVRKPWAICDEEAKLWDEAERKMAMKRKKESEELKQAEAAEMTLEELKSRMKDGKEQGLSEEELKAIQKLVAKRERRKEKKLLDNQLTDMERYLLETGKITSHERREGGRLASFFEGDDEEEQTGRNYDAVLEQERSDLSEKDASDDQQLPINTSNKSFSFSMKYEKSQSELSKKAIGQLSLSTRVFEQLRVDEQNSSVIQDPSFLLSCNISHLHNVDFSRNLFSPFIQSASSQKLSNSANVQKPILSSLSEFLNNQQKSQEQSLSAKNSYFYNPFSERNSFDYFIADAEANAHFVIHPDERATLRFPQTDINSSSTTSVYSSSSSSSSIMPTSSSVKFIDRISTPDNFEASHPTELSLSSIYAPSSFIDPSSRVIRDFAEMLPCFDDPVMNVRLMNRLKRWGKKTNKQMKKVIEQVAEMRVCPPLIAKFCSTLSFAGWNCFTKMNISDKQLSFGSENKQNSLFIPLPNLSMNALLNQKRSDFYSSKPKLFQKAFLYTQPVDSVVWPLSELKWKKLQT